MDRLVAKIKEQFFREAVIEIYVLDESGSPMELYSGLPHALTTNCLELVLKDPSTFYVFSVVGIDENFADMIDIHRDKMSRKEFCWLTDPLPPVAEARSDTSLALKWDPIRFCGVDVSVVSDSITYILEGCEGQEWKGGIASKFVSDISASEYKLIAKGPRLERIVLEDLKPAKWYHFRLTIQYLSTTVTSQTKSFATVCSPPNQPKQPYVYLIMNENNMFENKSRQDPQVRLSWNEPNSNGSAIKKYHVQIMEYYDSTAPPSSTSPSDGMRNMKLHSPESTHSFEENEMTDNDQNNSKRHIYVNASGQRFIGTKWRTVYCNLLKTVLLESPRPPCRAWGIRLRALNTSGWSSYSEILHLDHQTHSQLFTSSSSPTRKLPPLQKQISGAGVSTGGGGGGGGGGPKITSKFSHSQSFPQSGREFHNGNVDMWAAASSSSISGHGGDRYRINEEDGKMESQEGFENRSSTAPQAKYNQPRCKTPSLLLPASPVRQNSNVIEALNRSLSTTQENETPPPNIPIDSSLLEKEVERLWERTHINRAFIQLVIENVVTQRSTS